MLMFSVQVFIQLGNILDPKMFSAQNFVLGVDWGYFLPKSQLSHQPKICKFLPILGIELKTFELCRSLEPQL